MATFSLFRSSSHYVMSACVAGKVICRAQYRAILCRATTRDEIFLTKSVDARGRSLNNSASRFTALMPQHPDDEVKHFSAPVAQLDRVPGYELGGREFESLRAHHFICEAGCLHPVLFSRRSSLFHENKSSEIRGVL
jgi:hypothetical protein